MNKALIIIGVVLLGIGILAGAFTTTTQLDESVSIPLLLDTSGSPVSSTPYAAYMIPLLIGGIVLIIAGAVAGSKK